MWVKLPSHTPPYQLAHLFDSYDYKHRVAHCSEKTPGWLYGWAEGSLGPQLSSASQLCARMRGTNILMIGDSLTQQMYQGWRARLREERFANGKNDCAGNTACESSAPALCKGLCAVPQDDNSQHSAHRSVCDNGATVFQAQAFRWVLDVSAFSSSDQRHRPCAERVQRDPYSFGLVVIPRGHLRQMLEVASQPSMTRLGKLPRVRRLVVVVNQMAHIHGFVDKLAQCYQQGTCAEERPTTSRHSPLPSDPYVPLLYAPLRATGLLAFDSRRG